MGTFLIPFDAANIFGGLHESLYADHTSMSSFLAVTASAVWSHLWHYPENLACLTDVWGTLYASCLQIILPFLVPLILWFGLDRFVRQSENAFHTINRLVDFEREKLSSAQYDTELKQCLEQMKKNRHDYQELLKLCDQFPGQRAKADLLRLRKARSCTSGSGDKRLANELSDSTDTECPAKGAAKNDEPTKMRVPPSRRCIVPTPVMDSDSDRTFPGYSDEDDDEVDRLNGASWRTPSSQAGKDSI